TTIQYIETTPWMKLGALILQQDLKPLGVTVTLKPVTQNSWFTQFFSNKLTGLSIATEFNATVNDPSALLTYLVGKGGAFTFSHFTTPQVASALSPLATSESTVSRWAASKTILTQIATQVPYIPLYIEPQPYALARGYALANGSRFNLFDLANGD